MVAKFTELRFELGTPRKLAARKVTGEGARKSMGETMGNEQKRRGLGRNPFPHEPFYCVPIKLHECGMARELTGSQFKRYSTLLRLANYHKKTHFRTTLKELEKLDGVSPRRAHDVHPKLEERGLVLIETKTNPYTYVVLLPSEWRDKQRNAYLPSKIPRSFTSTFWSS